MQGTADQCFRIEDDRIGDAIYELASEIFPICRSITGAGVRETLETLRNHVPIKVREVATGTKVFDWDVPREWRIREAYIADRAGRRVVDFAQSNLHVVSYSGPVRGRFSLEELREHIFTLPDQPTLIPYRTSYYADTWGFCMAHEELCRLEDDSYDVVIDASLTDGSLTYGEYFHRGRSDEEVLLSAHICHPSLANDNCSGLALLTMLARHLQSVETRLSYRFVFAPGTIGAITWLAQNEARVDRIKHGLVVSCVGDGGGPIYKRSRRGDAVIDRVMAHVIKTAGGSAKVIDFSPYGYDERQYCSPGFDLPVGMFQRSLFGTFPEYHTSADNLDFIAPEHLKASFEMILAGLDILERNRRMVNLNPKCEPQLGRRGLYSAIGGDKDAPSKVMSMLWVLNLSDGEHSLLDISERSGLEFSVIEAAARLLEQHELLRDEDA